MSSPQLFPAIGGFRLGLALFASTAQAQPDDKRTFFTFSGPVAVPGATLPAGRYIFHLVDNTSGRKVIQVQSDDTKKSFAMVNTIIERRREAAKDPAVALYATAKGTPTAVKTGWCR